MSKKPPPRSAESEPESSDADPTREDKPGGGDGGRDWRTAFTRERESTKKLRGELEDARAEAERVSADLETLREETADARLNGLLAQHGLQLAQQDYLPVLRTAAAKAHPDLDVGKLPAEFLRQFAEKNRGLFTGSTKSGSGAGGGALDARSLAERVLLEMETL